VERKATKMCSTKIVEQKQRRKKFQLHIDFCLFAGGFEMDWNFGVLCCVKSRTPVSCAFFVRVLLF